LIESDNKPKSNPALIFRKVNHPVIPTEAISCCRILLSGFQYNDIRRDNEMK